MISVSDSCAINMSPIMVLDWSIMLLEWHLKSWRHFYHHHDDHNMFMVQATGVGNLSLSLETLG